MSYRFEAGRIYRMPTHFGPAPGPRQLPARVVVDRGRSPRRLSVAASFLTDAMQLERHLPEGFSLAGEPVAIGHNPRWQTRFLIWKCLLTN